MSEELWRSTEEWKDIKGYEGLYQASKHGRVKSLDRVDSRGHKRKEKIITLCVDKDGYMNVNLSKNGKMKSFRVHRLVLSAFVGVCPERMQGCHNDGNPANNRLENLRWGTHKENISDKKLHGTEQYGEKHGRTKLKNQQVQYEILPLLKMGLPHRKIADMFGVTVQIIGDIATGKRWSSITGLVYNPRRRVLA